MAKNDNINEEIKSRLKLKKTKSLRTAQEVIDKDISEYADEFKEKPKKAGSKKVYIGIKYDSKMIERSGKISGFPIFRYTLRNLLLSPSTFLFTIISIGTIILLTVLTVPKNSFTIDEQIIKLNTVFQVVFYTVFLSAIFMIFLAVKATQIFREEIDEGTLLVVLSKPITRFRLLLQKWIAYQTCGIILVLTALLTTSMMAAFIVNSSRANVWIFTTLPLVLFFSIVFQLIFSSIFLIISLRASARTVILTGSIIAILFLLLNVVLPLIGANTLMTIQKSGNVVNSLDPTYYSSVQSESNSYQIISFFNIGYQFNVIFVWFLNGFHISNSNVNMAYGSSIANGGPLSMFTIIRKPIFNHNLGSNNFYQISKWTDFIQPYILFIIYGCVALILAYFSKAIIQRSDYR